MPLNLPPPKSSTSASELPSASSPAKPAAASNGAGGLANTSAAGSSSYVSTAGSTPGDNVASSSSSFASRLGLPPPKTKSKQAATNQPKKFVLDLPKATRSAAELEDGHESANGSDEPANKKARTAGSGLNALLPKPQKAAGIGGLRLPEPKTAVHAPESSKPATSMVPHTVKGKNKAVAKGMGKLDDNASGEAGPIVSEHNVEEAQADEEADSAVLDFFGLGPATAGDEVDEDEQETDAGPIDFFGLSATSPSMAASSGKNNSKPAANLLSAKPAAPSLFNASSTSGGTVKRVSAAPTTAAPDLASNYYATLPVPTKADPYPGFYQKPDGNWAPKRPDEWEIWSNAQGWGEDAAAEAEEQRKKEKEHKMPADFSAAAAEQSVEVRAANLRSEQNNDLAKPSKFTDEEQQRIKQEQNKAKAKKFSHNARSRHQLTTLVADAQMNRIQLEDRISQMKANKRTGGQKYGF